MSIGLIEIVDSGLRCCVLEDPDDVILSPGYAMIDSNAILFGESARSQAFLNPQAVFSQYWQLLNLSPLPYKTPVARHNADLAFAHLNHLFSEKDKPEKIVLAVPASFDREQLGLILGLAKAAQLNVVGLVDAALLAVSGGASYQAIKEQCVLHIDIQLQQLLVTRLEVGGEYSKSERKGFLELGLRSMLDKWAHVVADKFIQQYRFDPMHNAEGEQQIHDLLPEWLRQLSNQSEIPVELRAKQGQYQSNISRAELNAALTKHFSVLKAYTEKHKDSRVVLSHRVSQLPGIAELFPGAFHCDESALISGLRSNIAFILSDPEHLVLIDRLPSPMSTGANGSDEVDTKDLLLDPIESLDQANAVFVDGDVTHIVFQGQARPIAETLSFDYQIEKTFTLFVKGDRGWQLVSSDNISYSSQGKLKPGDSLIVGGSRLEMINLACEPS